MLFYVSRRYRVTPLYLFKKVSSTERPKGPKSMPSERDAFSSLVSKGQHLVVKKSFLMHYSLCQQVKQVVGVGQTDGVPCLMIQPSFHENIKPDIYITAQDFIAFKKKWARAYQKKSGNKAKCQGDIPAPACPPSRMGEVLTGKLSLKLGKFCSFGYDYIHNSQNGSNKLEWREINILLPHDTHCASGCYVLIGKNHVYFFLFSCQEKRKREVNDLTFNHFNQFYGYYLGLSIGQLRVLETALKKLRQDVNPQSSHRDATDAHDPVTTKSLASDGGLEEILKKFESAGSLDESLLALGSTNFSSCKTPAAFNTINSSQTGYRSTRVSQPTT